VGKTPDGSQRLLFFFVGRKSLSHSPNMTPSLPLASPIGARIIGHSIQKDFPDTGRVVDQVDLQVQPGEFISFLGPSGCGKSTLLRMIAGLDLPSSGSIETHGGTKEQFFKGFVFQEAHLVPWRTGLQNVSLPLELMGVSPEQSKEQAREALRTVGLGDSLQKFPNQLSGGMKMRVSVARALVGKPTLLLLDEPFAALDEMTRHALQEDLRSIWRQGGLTVIFVTHSVREAVFLSERICVFSNRPTRIVQDFRVNLPAIRNHEVRVSDEYSREIKRLYASVSVQEAHL